MSTTLLKKPTGFDGFGPSILAQQMRGRLRGFRIPADRLAARESLRTHCPLVPGVYGWVDANRRLTYVGKSKSLRKRLLSYFAKQPADKKTERIRQNSRFLVWEPISHELLALVREQELIHRWRPEFNSMGQPTRMQPAFLCISGSPAPNARLARQLNAKHAHAFGPITGTGRLRDAIARFNQVFRLRDCPDRTKFEFANQRFLFDDPATAKCIRHELGTCPGPCAGICTRSTYQQQVEKAVSFLQGDSRAVLENLESNMRSAAARMAFETAAIYRDCLEHLQWLDRRLQGLRMAEQELNGILPIAARRQRTGWLALKGGRICFSAPQPDREDRADVTRRKIEKVARGQPVVFTSLLETSLRLIVISWFRKNKPMKEQLLSFDEAVEKCHAVLDSSRTRRYAA